MRALRTLLRGPERPVALLIHGLAFAAVILNLIMLLALAPEGQSLDVWAFAETETPVLSEVEGVF